MTVYIEPSEAKYNLAVNLWYHLRNRKERSSYAWLASELSKRYRLTVHQSRIQKILEQTATPGWDFLFNIADVLHVDVAELGKTPTAAAVKAYSEKYPHLTGKSDHATATN